MHHANYFYGHAHILASYCGLSDESPPRIRGYLQHGWNVGDGLAPGTRFIDGSGLFVWSERTRRRAWSMGRRNIYVTGAPWAYLLRMHSLPAYPNDRSGTIWYPFHGWEGQEVLGDHSRLISEINDIEKGPVTICLHWNEYQVREIRRLYEQSSFRVICHGQRGYWWQGTDPDFLVKQLHELRRHRRVASNRMGSAILYGASVGCETAVYGNPMIYQAEDVSQVGQFARIRREWSDMYGEAVPVDTAFGVASAELGLDYVANPDELRELLGWQLPTDKE